MSNLTRGQTVHFKTAVTAKSSANKLAGNIYLTADAGHVGVVGRQDQRGTPNESDDFIPITFTHGPRTGTTVYLSQSEWSKLS